MAQNVIRVWLFKQWVAKPGKKHSIFFFKIKLKRKSFPEIANWNWTVLLQASNIVQAVILFIHVHLGTILQSWQVTML